MNQGLKNLSKALSHALRHDPGRYGIVLDSYGWTDLDELIIAIGVKNNGLRGFNRDSVQRIMEQSDKQRFELDEFGFIRACYGHSVEIQHENVPGEPPEFLYHGTPRENLESIQAVGLLRMGRQFVHASENLSTAEMVARRWGKPYVILKLKAREAWRSGEGYDFYNGNDDIWMMQGLHPQFIEVM